MIDIVYVHRQKNSDEILWSIKSLKNVKHRNIYIIGDPVSHTAVINIPHTAHPWAKRSKYHDQISKLMQVCSDRRISETFLLMNDDMYITKPWQPVNYNRGTLSEHFTNRGMVDQYSRSLMYTDTFLANHSLPALSYELHTPFLMEKTKLKSVIESLPLSGQALQIRSIYGNTYDVPTEFMEDVKNTDKPETMTLLSTSENTFRGELGDYIRKVLI